MPRGIPKSGRRASHYRTAGVVIICEACGKPRRFTSGEVAQRGKIRFCSRECFHATIRKPVREPRVRVVRERVVKPPRVPFDMKVWRDKNRQNLRDHAKAWVAKNREKRREITRRWRERNADTIATYAALRRSNRNGPGAATASELLKLKERAGGRCVYCGIPTARLEFDHVEPVARGGDGTRQNFAMACRACNAAKGARDPVEWVFENHGVEGLARAVVFLEGRKIPKALYPGTKIVEVMK